MQYTDRLETLSQRFDEIEAALANPGGAFDQARFTAFMKERSQIEETVKAYRAVRDLLREIEANEALAADAGDPELAAMAQDELESLRAQRKPLEEHLQELMLPRDPNDVKDIFIEVRAGAGGDEAGIFAGDLMRMYTRYAESRKMRVELLSESENEAGGYKEVVIAVKGGEPYRFFKHESGVHRVQRVPVTESAGRVHTSTATVAVLPEAQDVDVAINETDLKIDTLRSSGAGGQHVNKTESAVRVTHLPSGIVVMMQEDRSQHRNKAKAMAVLRTRLYDFERHKLDAARAAERRGQVGTGDRSERIRTYNYPQGRVSDHRINLTLYKLPQILEGEALGEIIDALVAENQAALLAAEEVN